MFIKCWQNVLKKLTKRSENVDKTVRNVLKTFTKRSENVHKTVRNVHKTFWKRWQNGQKRSQNAQKRSQNAQKRWQNAQKRSQDVLKTFTTHSENIDQSVFSVHKNVEGRTGHWFRPCVHASWTVYLIYNDWNIVRCYIRRIVATWFYRKLRFAIRISPFWTSCNNTIQLNCSNTSAWCSCKIIEFSRTVIWCLKLPSSS
jgi:hypothetical protein